MAAVAASTTAPVVATQPGAAAAAGTASGSAPGTAPSPVDAMFAVLLQQLTPGATPANDATPAQTDNAEAPAQPAAPTTDNTNMSLVALLQQLIQQPAKSSQVQAPVTQDNSPQVPQDPAQGSAGGAQTTPAPANGNAPAPQSKGTSPLPPPVVPASVTDPSATQNPAAAAQDDAAKLQPATAATDTDSAKPTTQPSGPQSDIASTANPVVVADAAQVAPQPKQPSDKTGKTDAAPSAAKDASPDNSNNPSDAGNTMLALFVAQQLQAATSPTPTPQTSAPAPVGSATSKAKDSTGGPVAVDANGASQPGPANPHLPPSSQQASSQQPSNPQPGADGGKLTSATGKPDPGRSDVAPQPTVPAQPAPPVNPSVLHTASQPIQTSVSGAPAATPLNGAAVTANVQVAPQHHDGSTVSSIDALGLTIAAKSVDGIRHFDIRLDPPELGQVQVQLSLDDAGKAQATLVVDKPQTLELLQRDAPNLNRALSDAGLNLSNNGLNFSLREQYRQNSSGGVDKGRGRSLSVKAVVGTTSSSGPVASFAPNSVKLDIRV